MALQKSGGELPPGATILSEEDALEYQRKLLLDWKPRSDVWPFTYGLGILGGLSALSGIYINSHYRTKLRLNFYNYGKLSTFLPIVFLPTAASALFHHQYISNDILIEKTPCPMCVEMRAISIQCFFGMVYPTLLAPLGNFVFATRHGTYNLPFVTTNYKSVFQVWKNFTRPIGNILLGIAAVQAIAAMGITYLEAKSFFRIQKKLVKLEEYFDSNLGQTWNEDR